MNYKKVLPVFSSLLFLLPAWYAFSIGEETFGILAVLTSLFSTFYHFVKPTGPHWWWDKRNTKLQQFMLFLDTFVAIMFISYGTYIFYIQEFPTQFYLALLIFIPLFIQFMFPTKKHYELQHAIWHSGTAVIAFLPLFQL